MFGDGSIQKLDGLYVSGSLTDKQQISREKAIQILKPVFKYKLHEIEDTDVWNDSDDSMGFILSPYQFLNDNKHIVYEFTPEIFYSESTEVYDYSEEHLESMVQDLENYGLLNEKNIKKIKDNALLYSDEKKQYDQQAAKLICTLKENDFLEQNILELILEHDLNAVAQILDVLIRAYPDGTHAVKKLEFILKSKTKISLDRIHDDYLLEFQALNTSEKKDEKNHYTLTSRFSDNWPTIIHIRRIAKFLTALQELQVLSILDKPCCLNIIVNYSDYGFIKIAETLLEEKYLTTEQFVELIFHPNAGGIQKFFEILDSLVRQSQIAQDKRDELINDLTGDGILDYVLNDLEKNNCFRFNEVRIFVEKHEKVYLVCETLQMSDYNPEDNYPKLFEYIDILAQCIEEFQQIPPGCFDNQFFNDVIDCCEEGKLDDKNEQTVVDEIKKYINQIINEDLDEIKERGKQSTHHPKVEKAALEIARNLKRQYNTAIDNSDALEQKICQLISRVNALPSEAISVHASGITQEMKNGTAQRFFKFLEKNEYGAYFGNELSWISFKSLLGWIACAIEDLYKSDEDPLLSVIVEAAYQSLRGDNLTEEGIDNQAPEDVQICPPGIFNKWAEMLIGRHPAADPARIDPDALHTEDSVRDTLLTIIKDSAVEYLISGHHRDLFNTIKEQGNTIEAILSDIEESVKSQANAQAKPAYELISDREEEDFNTFYDEFIKNIKYVTLEKLHLQKIEEAFKKESNKHSLEETGENNPSQKMRLRSPSLSPLDFL